jgi:putative endonuclease
MGLGLPLFARPYNPLLSWPAKAGHPGDAIAMSKTYFVYILASAKNGTLYIGVTNNLTRRVWEHRDGMVPGFTKKYGVKALVYFEEFGDVGLAINRETRLKKWKRRWKIELIEKSNPDWCDLYHKVIG